MHDDERLESLARAVLEGIAVDWPVAESSAVDDSMRRTIRGLKVIAEIADLHAGLSGSSDRRDSRSPERLDAVPAAQPGGPGDGAPTAWSALHLLQRVGEGAFGEVYRAWDTKLDREVALKLLHRHPPDTPVASAVIDEGRMLAQVRHPNVVTVHGADRSAGRVGLWMEFIHGRTLEQILAERGPFGAGEATMIGLDVCRALAAVHRAGLLHRDIKAHNVMREDGGRIVLMDFGAGVELGDDPVSSLAGTPLSMAPEVLRGQDATVRSDIYSVGVLLYRLVTGSYPVQGRRVQEVRDQHARGERRLLRDARPDLPDRFVRIVERALCPRPEDRYESAGAMEAALAAATDTAQVAATASAGRSPDPALVHATANRAAWAVTMSPRRALAIAAGLLVVASAALLWRTAATSEPPVIAVLPFKNLSAEPNSDYFVDGLTDEVIRNLSAIDGLAVRSSTSSFAFKDRPRNTREVGEQLQADLVLEASVLRVGTALRINAQLVRAADDVPLWSRRFDRELKDVFAIQDEISRSIVNELRLTLGRGQRRYNTNLEAYDLFLKARALQTRGAEHGLRAIDLFQQVVQQDPAFAPAHAGLANTYGLLSYLFPIEGNYAVPEGQARLIMRTAAFKALELDPLLADAHAAIGHVHALERDWKKAEASFRRALELNPSLTTTTSDFVLSTLLPEGKLDEALRQLESALLMDPLSLDLRRVLAHVQISAGLYDRAIENCDRVLAVDPAFPFVAGWRVRALLQKGRTAEAIAWLERQDRGAEGYLGYAYALSGRRTEAQALAAKNTDFPQRQAMIFAGLGDADRAFEALERLAAVNPRRTGAYLTRPELANLRGDPRMAALRSRLGLPR